MARDDTGDEDLSYDFAAMLPLEATNKISLLSRRPAKREGTGRRTRCNSRTWT